MPWYEDWFDRDEYELVYQCRDEDEAERAVDLVERLAAPDAGAEIVDAGCGRGRHARALARRGYRITGFDLSARALRQARRRAEAEGLSVRFVQNDLRQPLCTTCADGVVNLFSSFGYFEKEADHQRAVQALAETLRPGGFLVQDFLNAPEAERTLVPEDTTRRGGVEINQQRWIEGDRINKEITLHENGAERTFTESVRLLTLGDFETLYAAAGLTLRETCGDYDGRAYAADSPRLILYAVK